MLVWARLCRATDRIDENQHVAPDDRFVSAARDKRVASRRLAGHSR
jgi:hypothetical protein